MHTDGSGEGDLSAGKGCSGNTPFPAYAGVWLEFVLVLPIA